MEAGLLWQADVDEKLPGSDFTDRPEMLSPRLNECSDLIRQCQFIALDLLASCDPNIMIGTKTSLKPPPLAT